MSYTIYKTDGTQLTQVQDGQFEQVSTPLTLVGKNTSSYGNYLNENFVHLLENFASDTAPSKTVVGQLWFDTNTGRLKVYDGNLFKVTGGALVSASAPAQLAAGDIWIDSTNQQMYFNDGTETILAAPIYTKNQGKSGFQTVTVLDQYSIPHTVLFFYLGNSLLGIYSLDTFTPLTAITGYTYGSFTGYQTGTTLTITGITTGQISVGQILSGTGITSNTVVTAFKTGSGGVGTYSVSTSATVASTTISASNKVVKAGFNVSSYPGITFNVPVSTANALIATDGTVKTVDNFMSTGDDSLKSITTNQVVIANDNALTLGSTSSSSIYSGTDYFDIIGKSQGANFRVKVVPTGGSSTTALFINANAGEIGVYTETPQATLDVNGGAIIRGSLSITSSNFSIGLTKTPANGSAAGTTGSIAWDNNYMYVCTGQGGSNNWKRIALTTF